MELHRAGIGASRPASVVGTREATFRIGQVVRHRYYPLRGVIFDVDPEYNNSEEWWLSIPEDLRPDKDQPFYHLLAENDQSAYVAYVSEQNLVADDSAEPVVHPAIPQMFSGYSDGQYQLRPERAN
ncbi:MAG TPA: heat shock protein HspQ [Pedomonas sp.]